MLASFMPVGKARNTATHLQEESGDSAAFMEYS